MRKHNRQGNKVPNTFVCTKCQSDDCNNCVDVLRAIYTDDMICKCKRKGHSGDPVEQQVADPFTGTVHGPAATITAEGEVEINDEFRDWWREQFGTEFRGIL